MIHQSPHNPVKIAIAASAAIRPLSLNSLLRAKISKLACNGEEMEPDQVVLLEEVLFEYREGVGYSKLFIGEDGRVHANE